MTAIFRSTTSINNVNVSPATINKPAGVVEGDLLLLHVGLSANIAASSLPAGFTLVPNAEVTGTNNVRIYQKVAGAAEPANYSVSFAPSYCTLGMIAVRSDVLGPLSVNVAANQTNLAGVNPQCPSVTTTQPNTVLFCAGTMSGATSVTADPAMIGHYNIGSIMRIFGMSQAIAATGATGTRTGTGSTQSSKTVSLAVTDVAAGTIPNAPSGLTAAAISSSQIDITFVDNSSNETGFELETSNDGTIWSYNSTLAANTTTYSHTGLSEAQKVYYRVRAVNATGTSDWTATASATTALIAPTGLTATGTSASQITLEWQDNSFAESGYEVEQSSDGVSGWMVIYTTSANATTHLVTGLAENTQLYFRVRALENLTPTLYSAYTSVASALTLLLGHPPIEPRFFLLNPQVVFSARVNQPTAATYPIESVVYDTVTTGAYTAIKPGMTLLIGTTAGGDDLGRQRVRSVNGAGATGIVVWVGRSSRGTHDGELTLQDNAYITAWDDRRVWAKVPYIASDGEIYKDSNVEVETNTINPPPVANCGPGFAATINATTSLIQVLFNGQNSFAVAGGATITTYAWNIKDGTLTAGTLASNNITATFPPGFRYVELTVTDSNSKSHTAVCPVYARDPANDGGSGGAFDAFAIESRRYTEAGQQMTLGILADMPLATYKDGTLAMVWEREPTGSADRDHMLISGWLDTENATLNAGKTGLHRNTTLTILDVAAKLDALPGFPQSLAADSTRDTALIPAITWSYMTNPNLDKYLHYLLHWHSTALELADFTWSGQGASYPFVLLSSDGASLWQQVDRRARAFLPDFVLTCDLAGRIAVVPDPMLRDPADRTAIVLADIDEDEWSSLRFGRQRAPRVHWLYGNAILAGSSTPIRTAFSIAPGDAPGQGVAEQTQGEKLALSQATLNSATGHRYARINAAQGLVTVTLVQNDDGPGSFVPWREIEPARKQWVTLTMSAETSAQRGVTFTAARGLPKEVSIRYNQTKTGMTRTVELVLEMETGGEPGLTVIKPEVPAATPVTYTPPVPWTVPDYGDTTVYYGDINGYVLYSGNAVLRTWDLQAASPVWERVDTGITGTILDGQYVHVNASTVGMWLMTSDAIWWCGDIMATTPSWSAVLPIATVRAADAPVSGFNAVGVVDFKSMFNYATEPGYLIVATGPPHGTNNLEYVHSYSWHTHDYGATWTQVDMDYFTFTALGYTRGYFGSPLYSTNIYRSAPGTIWMLRSAPRMGGQDAAVFKSVDLGHTWTKEYSLVLAVSDPDDAGLLNPYPNLTDPSYAAIGENHAANFPSMYRSTDGWATATLLPDATGYNGMAFGKRPNKRTFNNTHVMAWWRQNVSPNNYHLRESYDQGATWSLLWNSALATPNYNTPNGWPPDVNQWVIVKTASGLNTTTISLTLDNFATLLDKKGNLASVLPGGTWAGGYNNGYALPKV